MPFADVEYASSISSTPSGNGYWIFTNLGRAFAFGDAGFIGSIPGVLAPGQRLNQPVTGMVRYANGYLMVAADGGIFSFSNQPFHGSLGGVPIEAPIFAVAVAPGRAGTAAAASPASASDSALDPDRYPSRWVAAGIRTLSA